MVIIKESKRDDLLLPYLEMVRQRGINMTLGQFKTYMLELLTAKGGMHNLSLSSNYYLAGVTKYYFNGDLTLNKDLSVYKGDPSATDQWNEEACKRLDALVLILRNAYIDSVGEKFEIEEDFGTLSLPKLLRKYNKKINEALGIVVDKKKKEKPEKVYDPNVGKGYTYEILYNFQQGTKFERYTAPGSWCITYGNQYYKSYMRNLGIHYVIFLKNGYESIPRPKTPGPGFTSQKPHDEYGNSMIAVLQRNDSWEPTYITSRWNHGWGDVRCEADHAYTLQEFENITGVTDEDLKRIWKEWSEKKTTVNREIDPHKAELREEKKQMLRKLKYAQMRLNGGELPQNLFLLRKKVVGQDNPDGTANFKKGIFVAQLKATTNDESYFDSYKFVIDRGKVLFESLSNVMEMNTYFDVTTSEKMYENAHDDDVNNPSKNGRMQNIVIIPTDSGYLLYDTRRKDYVNVDGVKKFKYIPNRWSNHGNITEPLFYTVALRGTQMAFIFCSNNQPLKLPNGEYWFSDFSCKNHDSNRYRSRDVRLNFEGFNYETIIEIIYDSSSREKYFYNVKQRRFIQVPDISDIKGNNQDEIILATAIRADGMYGLRYKSNNWYGDATPCALFNMNNERITLGGLDKFYSLSQIMADERIGQNANKVIGTELYTVRPTEEGIEELQRRGYRLEDGTQKDFVYDKSANAFLVIEKNVLPMGSRNSTDVTGNYLFYRVYVSTPSMRNGGAYVYYIYDIKNHGFLLNPSKYPSKYLFDMAYSRDGYKQLERVEIYTESPRPGEGYWNDSRTKLSINVPQLKIDDSTAKMGKLDKHNAEAQHQQPMPAVSLAEGDIRQMVAEAIKKLTNSIL